MFRVPRDIHASPGPAHCKVIYTSTVCFRETMRQLKRDSCFCAPWVRIGAVQVCGRNLDFGGFRVVGDCVFLFLLYSCPGLHSLFASVSLRSPGLGVAADVFGWFLVSMYNKRILEPAQASMQ